MRHSVINALAVLPENLQLQDLVLVQHGCIAYEVDTCPANRMIAPRACGHVQRYLKTDFQPCCAFLMQVSCDTTFSKLL